MEFLVDNVARESLVVIAISYGHVMTFILLDVLVITYVPVHVELQKAMFRKEPVVDLVTYALSQTLREFITKGRS